MSDIARALAAPKKTPPTVDEARRIAALVRPGATFALRPVQIEALLAMLRCRGALLALGVGHGKSLLAWLAGPLLELERVIIMCPPRLVESMRAERQKFASSFYLGDADFLPYSQLSQTESEGLPQCDLVVADEAHALKHFDSARTRRFFAALAARPNTRFIAMSGSFTPRSVKDFAHLACASLRDQSPLPFEFRDVAAWDNCTNPTGAPVDADYAWTRPLLDAYPDASGKNFRERAQDALGRHLSESRGVVLTTEQSVACALTVRPLVATPPYPTELDCWPNGEAFISEEEQERVERTYTLGFWHRWNFGAAGYGDIQEWRIARSLWAMTVREELERRAEPGYDTPALVERRHADHPLLRRWNDIRARVEPVVEPIVESIWVGELAKRWGGLVWFHHLALRSILERSGVECPEDPPRDLRPCGLSIRRHGTGFNLQHFARMLVLEPPRSGATWQQLLGRLHRQGQTAARVEVEWLASSPFAERDFKRACEDAAFIERVLKDPQKLTFAIRSGVAK